LGRPDPAFPIVDRSLPVADHRERHASEADLIGYKNANHGMTLKLIKHVSPATIRQAPDREEQTSIGVDQKRPFRLRI
jgi:hypothetical protein